MHAVLRLEPFGTQSSMSEGHVEGQHDLRRSVPLKSVYEAYSYDFKSTRTSFQNDIPSASALAIVHIHGFSKCTELDRQAALRFW